MSVRRRTSRRQSRWGVAPVLVVLLILVVLGAINLAVGVCHVVSLRTRLQTAADSAAIAAGAAMELPNDEMLDAAKRHASGHAPAGEAVALPSGNLRRGVWDAYRRSFIPSPQAANAVSVTVQADGPPPLPGMVLSRLPFARKASAVALATPRDIALVIDLSGSMNDDTEPCWATGAIAEKFGPRGYPDLGNRLMEDLFADFRFGPYPGVLEHLGARSGVPQDESAYAALTADDGPLSSDSVPEEYRIRVGDDALTRKRKAYRITIDRQIRRIMPAAKPAPDSSTNYAYWAKYLDYVICPSETGPPDDRRPLPPRQDEDRILRFNNPNRRTFPDASLSAPESFRNRIGYLTYVQFMVDHGRDLQPAGNQYVPLSQHSPYCPWHTEETAGGQFRFPPRTQPLHAVRLAVIAALQRIKEHNSKIPDADQRDWVSMITFDSLIGGGPVVASPLSADYDGAMAACTRLQAVGDRGATAATESAMILAREHLGSERGRPQADKVVILLTDGTPSLYTTSPATIDRFIAETPDVDFHGNGAYWCDAPLMRAKLMRADRWSVHPVAVGLGADYDFMDRLARAAGTADGQGQSVRGSGDSTQYTQRLTGIFETIIDNPRVRLVQ